MKADAGDSCSNEIGNVRADVGFCSWLRTRQPVSVETSLINPNK
jgi:hypothetical protein